jgi:Phytanoyl-CoA dioxygenase (PhyH)
MAQTLGSDWASIVNLYHRHGFVLLPSFFDSEEVATLGDLVLPAHSAWLAMNETELNRGSVNSAYLTDTKYSHDEVRRQALLEWLAGDKLVGLAAKLLSTEPKFLNTQVFFNPRDAVKKPYWHRDIQYMGWPEDMQRERIQTDGVLHLRIPLRDDPGMEFISGSHDRWDTEIERKVRLELDGHRNHEELPGSVRIPHRPGDLLAFSAHVIHRGTYGGERLAFDVLFTS